MKFNHSILFLFLASFCFGQSLPEIDSIIKKEMNSDNVAALAVAVIDSGRVLHLSANGFRDIERSIKASVNTPFHIASVSTTVTNLVVFKLVEFEKIDLNTDINNIFTF